MFQGMTQDEILTLLVIYLILCGVVALIASARGKSPVGAFALSVLLSPLIGFLVTVLAGGGSGTRGYASDLADLEAMKSTGLVSEGRYPFELAKLELKTTGKRRMFNCGRCGKGLSLGWSECNHCRASFDQFPPVATGKVV